MLTAIAWTFSQGGCIRTGFDHVEAPVAKLGQREIEDCRLLPRLADRTSGNRGSAVLGKTWMSGRPNGNEAPPLSIRPRTSRRPHARPGARKRSGPCGRPLASHRWALRARALRPRDLTPRPRSPRRARRCSHRCCRRRCRRSRPSTLRKIGAPSWSTRPAPRRRKKRSTRRMKRTSVDPSKDRPRELWRPFRALHPRGPLDGQRVLLRSHLPRWMSHHLQRKPRMSRIRSQQRGAVRPNGQ
mmetsp:Transcript_97127/g.313064  ORF Transcript_97127/g.313064 Transcript_97127/m.313064 type:complete len:242 (+) Transcript_97127:470-1195(+)